MTVTKESPSKPKVRRLSTYEVTMQKIRLHCEDMESRGITLEKLIALRDQKRQLATSIQEGGRA